MREREREREIDKAFQVGVGRLISETVFVSKHADSPIKRRTFFCYTNFPTFLHFVFLNIHRRFNITNIVLMMVH